MKDIIKVLLQEGIDEETIHEVLNIINEVSVSKQKEAATNSIASREGVRKKRAEDLAKTLPSSSKPANKLVKAADKVIVNRGVDDAEDSIYGYGSNASHKMKKAELYLSSNKKKYNTFRDGKKSEQKKSETVKGYSTYNSPFYDERREHHRED